MREKVRVLIIEDKDALAADARREIEDAFEESDEIEVEVSVETDFDEGFAKFSRGESDVVVLDVRRDSPDPSPDDEAAGHAVYLNIKDARFAPVVFWTALPETVLHEQMAPLVTVVTKDDTDKLPAAIQAAVASRAVITISGIEQHVATVLRKHMWTELAPNWAEYTEAADSPGIAQVLLSRLSRVLEEDSEQSLTADPSHRYIYPPASTRRAPGDLLRASDATWWVILTPACDFAQDKFEFALLAKADDLGLNPRFQKWSTSRSKAAWNELERHVLTATQGRFYYLPAFRDIPDLVLDLENVRAVTAEALDVMSPVASLVSPFSEGLLVQHSQYRGRIGVPDLDSNRVKQRLSGGQSTGD